MKKTLELCTILHSDQSTQLHNTQFHNTLPLPRTFYFRRLGKFRFLRASRPSQPTQLHNTQFHNSVGVNLRENSDLREQANVNATTIEPIAPIETTNHTYSMTSRTKVALQVVPVKIINNDGRSVTAHALLDTGSEETFLAKTISDRLGLKVNNCNTLAVCTLSGESSVKVGQVNVQVKAVDNNVDRTLAIENLKVIDNLTITTTRARDLSQRPHLKDIKIPDVDDNQVTMLIGPNVPKSQVHEECRRGRSGKPYPFRAVLGWAVLGG